jgi:hypothetical protein
MAATGRRAHLRRACQTHDCGSPFRPLGVAPAANLGGGFQATANLQLRLGVQVAANLGAPFGPGALWQMAVRPGPSWRLSQGGGLSLDLLASPVGSLGAGAFALGLRWQQAW